MAPYGAKTETLLPVMTLAPRTMNTGILLLFCLLTLAHTVPVKREKREYDPDEIYYMNGPIRCLRCPPGNKVLRPCTTQDSQSVCASCVPGHTYSEHLTGMSSCLQCTVCRPDEEEVSPCTTTKNSICQCKEGTYCPPGAPCEVCQKCTTRCPPDLVIQMPCNSTSDAQCGPPETASNTTEIIVSVVLIIGLFAVVFCISFCCRKKKCAGKAESKWIPKILTVSFKRDEAPAGGADTPFLPQIPKLHFKDNMAENDKNKGINRTFNIFADLVPPGEFNKFVRELGLTENDIEIARRDNADTYERHYAMLLQLQQDKEFDVNVWLKKLCDMKKKKVAQDIAEKLVTEGLFERTS